MRITKRPCHTNNFRRGRSWTEGPDLIVVHVVEGSAAACRNWFANAKAQVSAHYLVTKTGEIDQFVDEKDTAYHAGRVARPTAPLVLLRPDVNPNAYSIGIEHEGTGREELTEAQRAASIALIREICTRRRIPMDRRHIVGHREIFAEKTCPGKIDVDALVRDLAIDRRQSSPPAAEPLVVWSDYFKDWLLVTRVISDTEWWFVPMGEVKATPRRSTSPLHAMKRKMV